MLALIGLVTRRANGIPWWPSNVAAQTIPTPGAVVSSRVPRTNEAALIVNRSLTACRAIATASHAARRTLEDGARDGPGEETTRRVAQSLSASADDIGMVEMPSLAAESRSREPYP